MMKSLWDFPMWNPPPAPVFYFYNTEAEVDRFVDVVKEIQNFFGQ
jgi:hypothetical protein